MNTKDVSEEIEKVLKELHAKGKQPTVALVKARLSSSVPMPAIIAAIKSWKGANRVPKIEITAEKEETAEQRIEKLEKMVTELTARIEKLEGKQ